MSGFFSQAELNRIVVRDGAGNVIDFNSAALQRLYKLKGYAFIHKLGSGLKGLPTDYYKAAFSAIIAHELKPYGASTATDLKGLMQSSGLHCGNYSLLTRFIFDALAPNSKLDVAMVGWRGGPIASHQQVMVGVPGKDAFLLDPTAGLIIRTGGLNSIMAGEEIPPQHIASFRFRSELAEFNTKLLDTLEHGNFRAGQFVNWYEVTDYDPFYISQTSAPTPQRESFVKTSATGRYAIDSALARAKDVNVIIGAGKGDTLIGRAAGDRLKGGAGEDLVIGGSLASKGARFDDNDAAKRTSAFFTDSEIAAVVANAGAINDIYAARRGDFLATVGSRFSALSEDKIRLAFTSVFAYDAKPLGGGSASGLDSLLQAETLDDQSHSLLAWRLFNVLSPSSSADVAMVEWNGGATGHHSQLLISDKRGGLLVDPTVGHLALVDGYNSLTAGEAVGMSAQRSFAWRPESMDLRARVIDTLDKGTTRGGDLLAWYDSPEQVASYRDIHGKLHWGTPQDTAFWERGQALSSLGGHESRDVIDGGAGADVLIGDGVVRSKGIWAYIGTKSKPWTVGDFDGDGKDDILAADPLKGSPNQVYLSKNGFFVPSGSWTGYGSGPKDWLVGDFNGDGKDDLLASWSKTVTNVFLSNGAAFDFAGQWTGASSGSDGWIVGDFNGDGKSDVLRSSTSGATRVLLSNGSSLEDAGNWAKTGHGKNPWYVGDFNGDGKTDLMRYTSGKGAEVFLSTGSSFKYDGVWSQFGSDDRGWVVQDVDGDGKDDLMGNSWSTSAGSYVLRSNGNKFVGTSEWSAIGGGNDRYALGDFDGDGKGDLLKDRPSKSGVEMLQSIGFGQQDDDRFYLQKGQVQGDVIADFKGAGKEGGDELWLVGFGSSDEVSLTHSGDTWTVSNTSQGISESFRIVGVQHLSANDFFII
ncbi:VCBS repeat-containing protein [Microvirga sp. 17 mud 1-3]|uniref:FG-GAP repeat domain-containing protein n=1 Tax=Microvirga sp. 17 mud 1-3 TaxID=2082949 RepID=UPI000D6CADDF|nr:VCBS repeat-containing protein [Microvirga sp. 17 mud 1-3]AWM87675.1 hypothetical protein C4E04_13655 [Microvirga sp. 17 mud 1-3]